MGRYRLTIQRIPRCDVIVVQPHLQPAILEALWDISYLKFDAQDRRISLQPRFLYWLIRYMMSASRLAAWLAATAEVSGARAIVGMDNFDLSQHSRKGHTLYEELGKLLRSTRVLSVQHGQELRRFEVNRPLKNVTLLCWGEWVAENFPSFGRNEAQFVTVGALVDGLYRGERPQSISKDVKLCIVSTIKDDSWWGPNVGERRAGYEELVRFVKIFQDRTGITIHVALTINRDHTPGVDEFEIERDWFLERLGSSVVFTEPTKAWKPRHLLGDRSQDPKHTYERFSTYYLSDRAEVTLGMSSSVLWESFGRGNKILSVNPTDNAAYDFPISGIWCLRKPSYSEFEKRLTSLLCMPVEEWDLLSRDARRRLIRYEPDNPPHVAINGEIKKTLIPNVEPN